MWNALTPVNKHEKATNKKATKPNSPAIVFLQPAPHTLSSICETAQRSAHLKSHHWIHTIPFARVVTSRHFGHTHAATAPHDIAIRFPCARCGERTLGLELRVVDRHSQGLRCAVYSQRALLTVGYSVRVINLKRRQCEETSCGRTGNNSLPNYAVFEQIGQEPAQQSRIP